MKRFILVLFFIALGLGRLSAAYIDLTVAQRAAESFVRTASTAELRSGEVCLVLAVPNYYVFNVGSSGFVVISSDDCFRPVIGYSNEGNFGVNDSPELLYYLDNLARGRQEALRAGMTQEDSVREEWSRLLAGGSLPSRNRGVSFYLVQTKWDQGDPYNKFCPAGDGGRSYAGCVATAMSQVMNYWKHPAKGQGNHTYHHFQYGDLSANFGETVYDFDKMPLSISALSPVEEIDAVAGFMYHCGIAVDMSYSPDGSGAYSEDVPEAVMRYFDYSNRCRMRGRDDYSLKEFQAILKDQFDMGWPCYYSGSDTEGQGGHAFVCDGYDDNDMFHFNWGWSGSGNGFYVIDGLNVSGYAFNSGQDVIINFVPSEIFENTMRAPEFFTAVPNGDEDFSVTLSWTNPRTTLDGHEVEAIDDIVILRDGMEVQRLENPVPGEAMTCVDVAGLPVMVNYTVYANYHGRNGRRACVNDINLGPTCQWTIKTSGEGERGWGSGEVTLRNASGKIIGSFRALSAETVETVELPQGWNSLYWTAPADSLQIGIEILDSEGQEVFSFEGPSTLMPEGLFFKTVNTCGGGGSDTHPSDLEAWVDGEDVVLDWVGVGNPGYGYNLYRDGFLFTMVADTTSFTDKGAATALHSYYVTAYCFEGETYTSNTVCAVTETEGMCPRNFDYSFLPNGRIQLSWSDPENTEGLAGYRVYRKVAGEEYQLLKSMGASYNSYTVPAFLEPGQHYFFKLVAMYDHGHLESSPAHALSNPDLCYVEVNLTHIPSGLTMQEQEEVLSLTWEPAWRAESYNLYRNGLLLAENLTERSYVDTISSVGERQVYQVTGVVNGVESSPSNKVVYDPSGLVEESPEQVMLYPNPSFGTVTIEAASLQKVEVYDMAGQRILEGRGSAKAAKVDLSVFQSGVYVVRIITGQGEFLRKLVLINEW